MPVLQISDYEDFPLPFNLEDLLDSSSITIESLLKSPPPQPFAHHSLAETATSLKDSPSSGVAPFSFPSIIPAASFNNTSLTFGPGSHMPSSSPNIYSSNDKAPSSKVNQTSREAISNTQLNFPWFPPFAPVPMTPRNSFE